MKGDRAMAFYNVLISSRVSYSTEVEADSEGEARKIALQEWKDCDISEMEFWDTHVADVYQD